MCFDLALKQKLTSCSRGKKVYRRFDDTGEDEEEIDIDDQGLLEDDQDAEQKLKKVKTLTRKSIKPTRLFQAEIQKRAKVREQEEEAATDIEEDMIQEPAAESSNRVEGPSRKANTAAKLEGLEKSRKSSPFDSWPRVKGSSRQSSASKGQKRSAAEALDSPSATGPGDSPRTRRARV